MKNKLLITTALAVLAIASNAYAGDGTEGLIITDQTLSDSIKDQKDNFYYGGVFMIHEKATVKVAEGVSYENNSSKSQGGVFHINEGSTFNVNSGVTFTGNKTGNDGTDKEDDEDGNPKGGGAIYAHMAKITIADGVKFIGNEAEHGAGGAIMSSSELTVGNVLFEGNKAKRGGAIYNPGNAVTTVINGATFKDNIATVSGGAIYNVDIAKISFTGNNVFSGNKMGDTLNDIYNNGTITVSGSLTLDGGISGTGTTTFETGSQLTVIAGTTVIDNKIVNNGATLNLTLDNGFTGESYNLLADSASLDNEFTIAQNNLYNIEKTETKGTYEISKKSSSEISASTGANANQAGAVNAITGGASGSAAFDNIANNINTLMQSGNSADVQTALNAVTALAPEVAPMVQSAATETSNQVFGAVSTRLTGGSVSSGDKGRSGGDNVFERGALWVQGLYNKSKLDDTSKAKGFDADSNGIAFGAEAFVSDNAKIGIGYAYTKTDIDGFMRDTDVDTHTAVLYGEYKPSDWYVNAIASYGWSDYEENKNVAGVGVKADYDAETFGLQAMTGYDMNLGGFGVTPEAGLRYVHIKQDAYKDTADQRVSANDSDILTGVVGARIGKNFAFNNGATLKPEAKIAATYDMLNDDVSSVVTLANGSAYSVKGDALERFGTEIGAGVTAAFNGKFELSVGYEGKFKKDYQDHSVLMNAKFNF